eukprot:scaffold36658_cov68-Phaeocystis_antarctica.AAC.1
MVKGGWVYTWHVPRLLRRELLCEVSDVRVAPRARRCEARDVVRLVCVGLLLSLAPRLLLRLGLLYTHLGVLCLQRLVLHPSVVVDLAPSLLRRAPLFHDPRLLRCFVDTRRLHPTHPLHHARRVPALALVLISHAARALVLLLRQHAALLLEALLHGLPLLLQLALVGLRLLPHALPAPVVRVEGEPRLRAPRRHLRAVPLGGTLLGRLAVLLVTADRRVARHGPRLPRGLGRELVVPPPRRLNLPPVPRLLRRRLARRLLRRARQHLLRGARLLALAQLDQQLGLLRLHLLPSPRLRLLP